MDGNEQEEEPAYERPMCTILGAAMYYLLLDYVVCNTMIWIELLLYYI